VKLGTTSRQVLRKEKQETSRKKEFREMETEVTKVTNGEKERLKKVRILLIKNPI
jgi:hypothetical protein